MNTESIVRRRAPATLLATALAATALAGCGGQPADMHAALAGPVAETVNGEAVSEKLVQALAARRNLDLSKPELRERVLKQLTDMTLLAQEARKAGYAKDPDFQANAELGRLQGLAVVAMKAMADDNKVDDAAVRAEYERQFPGGNIRMYDFDQLSFESEDDAKRALTEIATGKTFDQVMEEHRKEARVSRNFPKMRAEQMPPFALAGQRRLRLGRGRKHPARPGRARARRRHGREQRDLNGRAGDQGLRQDRRDRPDGGVGDDQPDAGQARHGPEVPGSLQVTGGEVTGPGRATRVIQ